MNIIIAGAGKVGATVAHHLAAEHHNITVVDISEDTLTRISNQLDVMCIKGSCASRTVLEDAGAEDADIVVAATSSDEINLLCGHTAKRLGVPYTVARVRNRDYLADLDNLRRDLGITKLINPESAAAMDISRMIRLPNAADVDTFAKGKAEIISFHVQPGDHMADQPLSHLATKIKNLPILFCAVERGAEVMIPNGSFVPQVGDKVYVAGTPSGVSQFFKVLGRHSHRVRSAFIIGGGRVTYYLLQQLEKLGIQCKVVEKNETRCRQLAEWFPNALILHGDGTDPELLTEECMPASDVFIALTDRDEDNLIISLYAHQCGVHKIIAKSNRQNYSLIARSAGVESVVSPKLTTAYQILRMVRGIQNSKGSRMTALHHIANGQAEAMEFVVCSSTRNLGTPLKDLKLKNGVLIAGIVRGDQVIIPEGNSYLQVDDIVIVIAKDSGIVDLNDIYADSFGLRGAL